MKRKIFFNICGLIFLIAMSIYAYLSDKVARVFLLGLAALLILYIIQDLIAIKRPLFNIREENFTLEEKSEISKALVDIIYSVFFFIISVLSFLYVYTFPEEGFDISLFIYSLGGCFYIIRSVHRYKKLKMK